MCHRRQRNGVAPHLAAALWQRGARTAHHRRGTTPQHTVVARGRGDFEGPHRPWLAEGGETRGSNYTPLPRSHAIHCVPVVR
jgi:hypothetical protein